jgi:predicted outer membrane repeat protein
MLKRWIVPMTLAVLCGIQTSCNLPQRGETLGDQGASDVIPCDVGALITAIGSQDELTLSPGCTYIFTHAHSSNIDYGPLALPAIFSEKTIHGNGATLLRSPASDSDPSTFRFLYLGDGAEVYIDDLHFENGGWGGSFEECPTQYSCRDGGAIYIFYGSLTLSNTTFTGNGAYRGGAIFSGGDLEIAGSLFENNQSRGGGALVTGANHSTVIRNSILRENYAHGHGGAIDSVGGTSIYSSVLERNTSTDHGGAINVVENGIVNLVDSTVNHNWAVISGAISSDGSIMIQNSTIAHNYNSRGGVPGYAAIGTVDSTFSLGIQYSTIANNEGAGTAVSSTNNALVHISNSIIAHNAQGNCSVIVPIETDGGANISTDDSCDGFMVISDPLLSPLADNGGATPTMALSPTSPAIDAATGDCLAADQRGVLRPDGNACDLGSYEYGMKQAADVPPYPLEMEEPGPERQLLSGEVYFPEEDDEPSKPSHTGRIEQAVPCFNGPGPMYAVVSSLQPGALVEIIGISENGEYIVILNPCYPGVPCWAEEGSIELHDQLDPSRVIPDPELPEEAEEGSNGDSQRLCQDNLNQADCIAAGGTWQGGTAYPPCLCP